MVHRAKMFNEKNLSLGFPINLNISIKRWARWAVARDLRVIKRTRLTRSKNFCTGFVRKTSKANRKYLFSVIDRLWKNADTCNLHKFKLKLQAHWDLVGALFGDGFVPFCVNRQRHFYILPLTVQRGWLSLNAGSWIAWYRITFDTFYLLFSFYLDV